jgi:hypothetical protein
MVDVAWYRLIASLLVVVSLGVPSLVTAQELEQQRMRAIPGITAEDDFPAACVSCHTVLPDGMDVRLSTLMQTWTAKVDSILLANARAAAPTGLTVVGKHPEVGKSLSSIPAGCLVCHGRSSTLAPPFGRLMHRIHLVGGEANHFMTLFNGECTYCHKFDAGTGEWSIPSGPEPGS